MAIHIGRREFITLLGSAAAWPLAAKAQQAGKLPTIGFLGGATPTLWSAWVSAFVQRLRELGWVEGRNVAIEYRWAEGRNERYAEIATEFVSAEGRSHRHGGSFSRCGKAGDLGHPNCIRSGDGSTWHRPRRQSGAPGWQHYRPIEPGCRSRCQAT